MWYVFGLCFLFSVKSLDVNNCLIRYVSLPAYEIPNRMDLTENKRHELKIRSTLDIDNMSNDIPKYLLISKNIVWTHFLFLFSYPRLLS